jgi:hypothetical protein
MGIDPMRLSSLSFEPAYFRPHGTGDWSGHIAFAYDLVAATKPPVIVELGTYYGESYFAFCQAVAELSNSSRCFAVDTWHGDSHTGSYGEVVYREVSTYNAQHYSGFSTLLRESFEEALQRFADGSIALLHIDGFHTYDAVRHDFETWLPKVRPGGIILFHDTAVRRANFGVWRFWEEVREQYDTFDFPHSFGLGILRKPGGAKRSDFEESLFQERHERDRVRLFYRICAERLEYRDTAKRLQRHGTWDLLMKFFWRSGHQEFAESRSIHLREELTAEAKEIRLDLPDNISIEHIRVDLVEGPEFFKIHAIDFLAADDVLVSSVHDLGEEMTCSSLTVIPVGSGYGIAARLPPGECSIILTVPTPQSSTTLRLTLSGMEAGAYAEFVSSIMQRDSRRMATESKSAAIPARADDIVKAGSEAARFSESRTGDLDFDERIAELRNVQEEAQAAVRRYEKEIQAPTAGLAEAREVPREYQPEANTTPNALLQAEHLVRDYSMENAALSAGLAEAQQFAQTYRVEAAGLHDALKEAQTVAENYAKESATLSAGLAEAQQFAQRYRVEAAGLHDALKQAQIVAENHAQENAALSAGLANAQDVARDYQSQATALHCELEQAQVAAQSSTEKNAALLAEFAKVQDRAQRYADENAALSAELAEARRFANENVVLSAALAQERENVRGHEEFLAMTRRELAGREEQMCRLACTLSEAQRLNGAFDQEIAELRRDLEGAVEAHRRYSDIQELYIDCAQKLRTIESSRWWKLTKTLRKH